MKQFRILVGTFMVLACAALASAQVIVTDKGGISFTASPDHNTTVTVGAAVIPIVTDYSLTVYSGTTTTATAFTFGLGKPTPDATNLITVKPLSATNNPFATLAPGTYVATVSANGSGGSAVSPLTDPFGRVPAPKATGKPVIVPQ